MNISRLNAAVTSLVLLIATTMLALLSVNGPRGGLEMGGLVFFADSQLTGDFARALVGIGVGDRVVTWFFAAVAAFDMAAAGTIVFASLFWLMGGEEEREEAARLAEGAALLCLLSAGVILVPGLAAGTVGGYVFLHLFAILGLRYLAHMFEQVVAFEKQEPEALPRDRFEEVERRLFSTANLINLAERRPRA
ncbi:hypothetical protein E2A64_08710 [Pseudohoeflea suaedae]|uniref:Uncharacterized protein n=1 Tax=Pseudohoeflea suaedae TaxID=877384 RepID=A0A4R5PPW2_9HYPH|nr:hypothetical protein [Pseudohoeflea suaedae]TDH39142.1 hypothetical protein E2A64_08710 [Pseudohoeflea suaedae]